MTIEFQYISSYKSVQKKEPTNVEISVKKSNKNTLKKKGNSNAQKDGRRKHKVWVDLKTGAIKNKKHVTLFLTPEAETFLRRNWYLIHDFLEKKAGNVTMEDYLKQNGEKYNE